MKKILVGLIFISSSLFADKVIVPKANPQFDNPWLTGPLITPSSVVVPVGHANFEPYLYVVAVTGSYDRNWDVVRRETLWETSLQPTLQIGLTSWMDCQFTPVLFYNYTQHKANWEFGDFPFQFDFQIFTPRGMDDWMPYMKLTIGEIFPTGKYRNLNPKRLGAENVGGGSFQTFMAIDIGKLFHLWDIHFMTARLNIEYLLPAPTKLKGFNAYGGGFGTKARLFPGKTLEVDFGMEITLAKTWALACDVVGTWVGKTHYSGNPGKNADGTPAILGMGSSAQFSLAPAIEYNWSANLGVIAGGWFTVLGRNSSRFWSSVIAVNYYI